MNAVYEQVGGGVTLYARRAGSRPEGRTGPQGVRGRSPRFTCY